MSTIKVDTVRSVTTDGSLTLQGDSSGSGITGITIDSSGNATLNGTANDLGTVTAGTLGSGVVFPAGHIIQTVSYTNTSSSSTTNSQTLQRDTNFSATINNVLANSYVLILTSYEALVGTVSPNSQEQLNHSFGLFRDTTNIFESATDVFYNNPNTGGAVYGQMPIVFFFLDTSPGTGTNVYYNGIRTHTSGYYTSIRGSATPRFITLFEIAQ